MTTTTPLPTTSASAETSRAGLPKEAGLFRRLLQQRGVPVALGFLALMVAIAILAPLIAPYAPNATNATNGLQAPSLDHWMGTDQLGRDVMSRLMYGSRISIQVGIVAVVVAMVIGVPLGLLAGFMGGFIDTAVMRVVDVVIAFPALILALAIIGALGSGVFQIMVAIGIGAMPAYARLARGQVLSVREYDFVMAARSLGASRARIMVRHVLWNSMSPLIVQASLGTAYAILAEAGLSFLGVGVSPPTATWGGMLSEALSFIRTSVHMTVFPGLAIFLTVLAVNTVGDALRDVLDPRLRGTV